MILGMAKETIKVFGRGMAACGKAVFKVGAVVVGVKALSTVVVTGIDHVATDHTNSNNLSWLDKWRLNLQGYDTSSLTDSQKLNDFKVNNGGTVKKPSTTLSEPDIKYTDTGKREASPSLV